jgi:hypothetical protein
MALALTLLKAPNDKDNSQRRTILEGTGVLSGSYPAGGEPITWTQFLINSSNPTAPVWVEFYVGAFSPPTAVPAVYDYATGTLRLFVSSTGDEVATGAYSSVYTSATLYFKAEFQAG